MTFAAFLTAKLFTSEAMSWRFVQFRLPLIEDLLLSIQHKESQKTQEYVTKNMQMMVSRLDELQAQVLHLDILGEGLSSLAGVKRVSPVVKEASAEGGSFIPASMTTSDRGSKSNRWHAI